VVVKAVYDREIRDIVKQLLAYQRRAPIHIRIVTPWIHDAELSSKLTLSQLIIRLIKYKDATVTLLVNPKRMTKEEEIKLLEKLEGAGVKVHYKRDLHAKLILLDSKEDKGVLVTSANLTPTGLGKFKEVGVYFLNEHINDVFNRLYDYITHLLKETNINIKGGDFSANVV
jgi:phosphatidylserine/phosphatidylglycerophosphate/cardiolipin synthase-like enzyme